MEGWGGYGVLCVALGLWVLGLGVKGGEGVLGWGRGRGDAEEV